MRDKNKTKTQLVEELADLRQRVAELETAEAERKRAEEKLVQSEEKYRNIVELAPDGIMTVNLKGVTTSCNSAFLKLTGFSRDEIVGKHISRFPTLRIEDIPKYIRVLLLAARGKPFKPFEFLWVHKDGTSRWGEAHMTLMKKGSRIIGLQLILRDITERKQSEERLRLLSSAVEQSTDGIAISDLDGNLLYANNAFAAAHGYTWEEIAGKHISIFHSPEQVSSVNAANRQLQDEGEFSGEIWHIWRDGTPFPTLMHNSLLCDETGNPIAMIGTLRDITDLKQAEEEQRKALAEALQATHALRESEERYRSLFDSVPAGLYRTIPGGAFLDANPVLVQILGYPDRETLLAANATDSYVNAADRQRWQALLEREGIVRDFEVQLCQRDGTVIWVRDSGRAIYDADGSILYCNGSLEDITERKRMEEQLRRHERLAAVGQLSAGIAHDFRNLLTTIILYANITLLNLNLPQELVKNVQTIITESKKAAHLVQQILDFSSRSMIETQTTDLETLTQDVIDILRRTIPENIQLLLEVSPAKAASDRLRPAYIVKVDPNRIEQALLNLSLNARDAMPEGGDLRFGLSKMQSRAGAKAPVAGMSPGEWVCLAVSDTGTGMTEKVRAHLFEPFFTTKEVGKGTGLGLAQVYGIIRQHEGYIDVETEPGKGSTFRIYLPSVRAEGESVEEKVSATLLQGQGEMLLWVEDNENLRKAGQSFLELLGYRVLTAANGHEALTVYEAQGGTDLVITDMVMPKMGGKELVQKLRSMNPNLKALGITGYAVEKVTQELRELGFLDVIHKPFDIETLAQVIRRALDTS